MTVSVLIVVLNSRIRNPAIKSTLKTGEDILNWKINANSCPLVAVCSCELIEIVSCKSLVGVHGCQTDLV
jgi:hypothetical protein